MCSCDPKAHHKLDEMSGRFADKLRRLTKQVQEAKQSHDDELVKRRVDEYDEALEWSAAMTSQMQVQPLSIDTSNYVHIAIFQC